MTDKKGYIKLAFLVAFAAAIAAVFQYTSLEISNFTPEKIKDFILKFGMWAPVVFLTIYTSRSVILVIPVGILSITSGLAFGPVWGWVLNVSGAVMGSSLAFVFARYFGQDFINKIPYMNSNKMDDFSKKVATNGFKVILVMRLIGIPMYDIVNFGSGLTKVKFKDYLAASLIGMIPGGFVLPFIGSNLNNLKSPEFIVGILLFILLMFVPKIYQKLKNRLTKT